MKHYRQFSILLIVSLLSMGFSLLSSPRPVHAAAILYVKPGAAGACASWADACDLQAALSAAASGDEIWVAAGTYTPGPLQTDTFTLKADVALYGGFAGTETARAQRSWSTNVSILSGEIGAAGTADNSIHVVSGSGLSASAVLDGFTISGGFANAGSGGGISLWESNPTLTHLIIRNNLALNGGGIYAGGGLNCSLHLTNIVFYANTAVDNGGGLYFQCLKSSSIDNATFYANTAVTGGGLYEPYERTVIGFLLFMRNSILWGNTASGDPTSAQFKTWLVHTSYSIVQGAGSANGNLDGTDPANDPLFVNPAAGDLRLQPTSPVINHGDPNQANLPATDLDGLPRVVGAAVDLGAYENQHLTVFVKKDASGLGDGTSWTDAYPELRDALAAAKSDQEIWVAAGTYTPGTLRADSFPLAEGAAIYGGFAGTETLRSQRSWNSHPTILSGEIGAAGTADNSYHVVMGSNLSSSAVLDGFTISAGNGANISGNGGGMYLSSSSPSLDNLIFSANSAYQGGAVYMAGGSPSLTNVAFFANSATSVGGGIFFSGSSPTLTNTTFYANTAVSGGGISSGPSLGNSLSLRSSILWGNTASSDPATNQIDLTVPATVTYSLVEGMNGGTGNLNGTSAANNPLFANPASGDLRLQSTSPAIDKGDPNTTGLPAKDLGRRGRVFGSFVDIGAYEYHPFLYVLSGASGAGDGTSWVDAYPELDNALATAMSGQEIWVAAGTYTPGTLRTDTFTLKESVSIYGGFAGTETLRNQRDWATNLTTLSGEIGAVGTADNSNHVVTGSSLSSSTVLDGFAITAGNTADNNGSGGGMYLSSSSPSLDNLIFSANSAYQGGAIYIDGGSPSLTNVAFYANSATSAGGGMFVSGSSPTLINTTFYANTAVTSGGIGSGPSSGNSISLRSCILWGNTASADPAANQIDLLAPVTVTYSLVEGMNGGTGNLNGTLAANDPLFVNAATGNLRLQSTSPAIDKGDPNTTGLPAKDLGRHGRIFGSAVDMGAYEYNPIVFVKNSAGGTGDGSSWTDAYPELQAALNNAVSGAEIWVAAGTYTPGPLRSDTFTLKNGVAIYGGFAGTETARAQRSWKAHPTVLSGEIGSAGTADNSYHVVQATSAQTASAVLDGFRITAGNATSVDPNNIGGGILVLNSSSPTLANLTLTANSAYFGGGMYVNNSSPTLTNVIFSNNSASINGGGMRLFNSSPTLTNVTFSSNSASFNGGGMYLEFDSNPKIRNSIFWGNTVNQIATDFSSSPTISYSLVEGGYAGIGNLSTDPRFARIPSKGPDNTWGTADDEYGDLRLQPTSPAIDQGDPNSTGLPATDLDGLTRIVGTVIDIGAYEQQTPNHAPILNGVGALSLNEDPLTNSGATVASLLDTFVSDTDGTTAFGIAASAADTANGKWQRSPDGITWSDLGTVSATSAELLSSTDYLRFAPSANWNGPATLTLRAWDGADGRASSATGVDLSFNGTNSAFSAAAQTLTATVSAVNDPPSFTKGGHVTVDENSGAYAAAWASAISKGPDNESAQTLSFTVSNNNNALFSVQPAVSDIGVLSFTPAASANGTATVTISLKDSGSGANQSPEQSFTITVNPFVPTNYPIFLPHINH